MHNNKLINKLFIFLIYVLFFLCNVDALLPVKQCNSLEGQEAVHRNLALCSIQRTCVYLDEKCRPLEEIDRILLNIVRGIQEEIAFNTASLAKLKEPYMLPLAIQEATLKTSVAQLRKKLNGISDEVSTLLGSKVDLSTIDDLPALLNAYKEALIKNICMKISAGDYSALFSSIPASLFINAHIPNTFTCAFTLIQEKKEKTDVYVKAGSPLSITINPVESEIFVSGDGSSTEEKEGFFKHSIPVQTGALGGSIPAEKVLNNIYSDLYRHSEQKSFRMLFFKEFIDSLLSDVNPSDGAVTEIVFHGNTFRDMCENCRATLISHEILSTRNIHHGSVAQESFLCAIQNAVFAKFGVRPLITCLISSFIEYSDRNTDFTWLLTPPVNLLNPGEISSSGVCKTFVNQYAFKEREFLDLLISQFKVSGEVTNTIKRALIGRYKSL